MPVFDRQSLEFISRGAELLDCPLEDLIERTIMAMRSLRPAMEI